MLWPPWYHYTSNAEYLKLNKVFVCYDWPWCQKSCCVFAGLLTYIWNAWGNCQEHMKQGYWVDYIKYWVHYIVRTSLLCHLHHQVTILIGMHCGCTWCTQKHHLVMSGEIGWSFAVSKGGICLLCGDLNWLPARTLWCAWGNIAKWVLYN